MVSPPEIPTLQDHVELGEELGRGGFGAVYRGKLRKTGQEVAVKLSHQHAAEDLSRIQREAALLRRLVHPRLNRFLGLLRDGTRSDGLALVYELLPGLPLDQALAPGPPSLASGLDWIAEIAEGLDSLHGAGLLHRDLKAENVFLLPDGHLKLLDFGLARPEAPGQTLTATGMILGTPVAMAPELFRGEKSTRSSDLYALACLAFEILSGAPPYQGDLGELMRAHLEGAPPRLSRRRHGVPATLDPVLQAALSPDPRARPASGAALAASLRDCLGSAAFPATSGATLVQSPMDPDSTQYAVGPDQDSDKGTASRTRALPPALPPVAPGPLSPPAVPVAAPGRPGRGPWILAGIALALATFLLTPPPPPTPPPGLPPAEAPERAEPGSPWPEELPELESLEQEVEDAGSGMIRGIDEDPSCWRRNLELLPRLQEVYGYLARGGRLSALGPGDRERLRAIDQRYEDQSLPPPFAPYLALPDEEEIETPDVLRIDASQGTAPPFPPRHRGWRALALRSLAEACQAERDLIDYLGRNQPSPFEKLGGRKYDGHELLRRKERIAWIPRIRPAQTALRTALHAMARALREAPRDEDTARTAVAMRNRISDLRTAIRGELVFLPLETTLAGPLETPGLKILAAYLCSRFARLQDDLAPDQATPEEVERRAVLRSRSHALDQEILEETRGIASLDPIHAVATGEVIRYFGDRKTDEYAPEIAVATFLSSGEVLLRESDLTNIRFRLHSVANAWRDHPDPGPFPEPLRRAFCALRDRRKGFGLPISKSKSNRKAVPDLYEVFEDLGVHCDPR